MDVKRSLMAVAAAASVALALAAPGPRAALAGAMPDTLVDSTWVQRWTLRNGLDVTVRHIPNGSSVAAVVAYRVGRDQDPAGRDGMADLLAELVLTAPAGDIPERSREEMSDLRPRGWNLQVTPRFSLISELASPERFPGLLRQVATRVRGVTVTDSVLARARRVATRDLGERYFKSPEVVLFNRLRDVAAGADDETILRRASGRALKQVTVKEASERLKRLYVPANAVLALAGNFEGIDIRHLVESLFADIPRGTPVTEPPPTVLKAAVRSMHREGLTEPLGIAGVIAPAITDSLHPSFYLNALLIGRYCEENWGAAPSPLPGRFRYPIMADPQLAQFFPPVKPGETDADQLGITLQDAVEGLATSVVDPDIMKEIRVNHAWILGGPLTPSLRARMREHPGTLHTLASTMAVRALWGDDAFWDRYLARFMDPHAPGGDRWADYFQAPGNIVRLLLTPPSH
jgi:hypothetical protein